MNLLGDLREVVAADVDGDGDLDLLTTNGQVVDVRFNNGSGVFGGGSSLTIAGTSTGTTFGIIGLAVGDVDGDLDLLAAGASSTGAVSLRLNNGSGVFSGGYDIPLGTNVIWPGTVALVDLDGDGDLDLLASQWYAGFEFRFNQGTPTATHSAAVAGSELEL